MEETSVAPSFLDRLTAVHEVVPQLTQESLLELLEMAGHVETQGLDNQTPMAWDNVPSDWVQWDKFDNSFSQWDKK